MATILIVDDRPVNRELLVTLLTYTGHHPLEAADGEEGLEIARAEHPDLIITDIVMPKMDGYEFARQVRADSIINNTQIIFYTSSYIVAETRSLAAACGVSIVIGKPIEPAEFLEQVRLALATKQASVPPLVSDDFHREHMRMLTDTLVKKVDELEAEIVERKQAQNDLRNSEELFRTAFQYSPVGMCITTLEGRLQNVNQPLADMLGFTTAELDGRHFNDITHPEDLEIGRGAIGRMLLGEIPSISFEKRYLHKSGGGVWVYISSALLKDSSGKPLHFITHILDIMERKQAEEALRESEVKFSMAFHSSPLSMVMTTLDGKFSEVNSAFCELIGYSDEEIIGKTSVDLGLLSEQDRKKLVAVLTSNNGSVRNFEVQFNVRDGSTRDILYSLEAISFHGALHRLSTGVDITGRKRAEKQLAQLNRLYSTLSQVNHTIVRVKDRDDLYQSICNIAVEFGGFALAWVGVLDESTGNVQPVAANGLDLETWPFGTINIREGALQNSLSATAVRTSKVVTSDDVQADQRIQFVLDLTQKYDYHSSAAIPFQLRGKTMGVLLLVSREISFFKAEEEVRLLEEMGLDISFALDTIQTEAERKLADTSMRASERRYRGLFEDSPISVWEEDFSLVKQNIEALRGQGISDFRSYFASHPEKMLDYASLVKITDVNKAGLQMYHAQNREDMLGSLREVITSNTLTSFHEELLNIAEGKTTFHWEGTDRTLTGESIEVNLSWSVAPGHEHDYSKVIVSTIDITERKQAEERNLRQLDYLTALQDIDRTIASSFEMGLSLNALILKAVSLLGVDASAILLLNYTRKTLDFAAGDGFRTNLIKTASISLEKSYAGRAAMKQRIVKIPNLRDEQNDLFIHGFLEGEDFVTYYGVPLIVKGRPIGVMEVFQRSLVKRDQEWLDFLNALAGQAAIAISNAQLFDNLQHSNNELIRAYDATIAGWSAALDLRDKETEGHSQRVTEMTVNLARSIGIGENELLQIRRGALLHDIGKLGIPDHILLKPGKLTDDEWEIMRKHPTYAYDMLSSVEYLKPALDIPHAHHEKWDGTGYPRRLKGEEIPVEARIFAIVDVWDALRSNRPYREGWPQEKVLDYLRDEAGKHFDPQVVEAFLNLIADK